VAKGIKIGVASDTREFATGVQKGVIKPLEDVSDALEDVARDGDKSGDKLEKALDGARKETSAFKKEQSELGKAIDKASDTGGTAIRKNVKKGTDGARESLDEMSREANSTAAETAASFDGSADSIAGAFQEIAANAFAGFGPAGAAAGLAIAIGLGAAIAKGQEVADAINDAKERVGELALEIYDAGGDIDKVDIGAKIREWSVEIADSREWFEIWQQDAVSNMEKASKAANRFEVDAKDMVRGLSGSDQAAALRSIAALEAKLKASAKAALAAGDEYGDFSTEAGNAGRKTTELAKAVTAQIAELKRAAGITGDAAAAAKLLAEVTAEEATATKAAEDATRAHDAALDARNDKISALQQGIDTAVGAFDTYKDAESGALDPAGYLANIQARIDATNNMAFNVGNLTTQFSLSQEEQQAILDLGLDFAPMLESIINSGLAPEFITQIQEAVAGGQTALDGSNLGATVTAEADTDPAVTAIDAVAKAKTEATVTAKADTAAAEAQLDGAATKSRTATITASVDTGAAERALDNLTNRARNVTIRVKVVDPAGREVL